MVQYGVYTLGVLIMIPSLYFLLLGKASVWSLWLPPAR